MSVNFFQYASGDLNARHTRPARHTTPPIPLFNHLYLCYNSHYLISGTSAEAATHMR